MGGGRVQRMEWKEEGLKWEKTWETWWFGGGEPCKRRMKMVEKCWGGQRDDGNWESQHIRPAKLRQTESSDRSSSFSTSSKNKGQERAVVSSSLGKYHSSPKGGDTRQRSLKSLLRDPPVAQPPAKTERWTRFKVMGGLHLVFFFAFFYEL